MLPGLKETQLLISCYAEEVYMKMCLLGLRCRRGLSNGKLLQHDLLIQWLGYSRFMDEVGKSLVEMIRNRNNNPVWFSYKPSVLGTVSKATHSLWIEHCKKC